MSKDMLGRVLKSIQRRQRSTVDVDEDLTLYSFHTLGPDDRPGLDRLFQTLLDRYAVKLKVVGGGYGCSRIDCKVDVDREDERAWQLWSLVKHSDEYSRVAIAAGLDLALVRRPPTRIDFRTGEAAWEPRGIEAVISYAHEDAEWKARLVKHFKMLEWDGTIRVWHDALLSKTVFRA